MLCAACCLVLISMDNPVKRKLRKKHAGCITAVHIHVARRAAVASMCPPLPYKWSHALCGNLIDAHYERPSINKLFVLSAFMQAKTQRHKNVAVE